MVNRRTLDLIVRVILAAFDIVFAYICVTMAEVSAPMATLWWEIKWLGGAAIFGYLAWALVKEN